MASFIGTNKEFRRYIGPRLRNLVQQITRNHKAEIAVCEHCGSKEVLESAHVHGRDRNEIIDQLLNNNIHNGVVTVDLDEFEERFKEEHYPLEKSILILCRSCHHKYDLKTPKTSHSQEVLTEPNYQETYSVNSEGYLPITLYPADPDIFKQELLVSKQAEIETTYTDGRIEVRLWNAARFNLSSNVLGNLRSRPEFRRGNWQTRGIKKVHVKVLNNS